MVASISREPVGMRRVAIVGFPFSANVGDGLIFEAMKSSLDARGIAAYPVDLALRTGFSASAPKESQRFQTGARFRSASFDRAVRRLAWPALSARNRQFFRAKLWEMDAVIIGGGQLLTDVNGTLPRKLRLLCEVAKSHNLPWAVFGCGVGTSFSEEGRRNLQFVLQGARFVSARGEASACTMKQLGARAEVRTHIDPVFDLCVPVGSSRRGVGIGYQAYESVRLHLPNVLECDEVRFASLYDQIIDNIVRAGRSVTLFTNGDPQDYEACCSYTKARSNRWGAAVRVAERPMNPGHLINVMREMDGVISFRMHAAILARALGVPTLNIEWDTKVREVWNEARSSEVVVAFHDALRPDYPWYHRLQTVGSKTSIACLSRLRVMMDSCIAALS